MRGALKEMNMIRATIAMLAMLGAAATGAYAQQPTGSWDFTTSADVIRDQSGGSDLRVEGCQWVPSKRGKALRVPAGSGRIWAEQPGAALQPAQALSIIAWVRPLGVEPYRAVVTHGRGWGDEGTAGYRLLLYLGGVRLILTTGGPDSARHVTNISGGKTVPGQWNQVAATYDGQEAVAYLNGQAVVRDLAQGPIVYQGVANGFEVGCGEGGNLDGEIASLRVYDQALSEAQVAADWQAGQNLLLTPEGITAERYAGLEKCSLARVPSGPFVRDRHTTLLAHMDARDNSDADYSRWEGRAGGWRLKPGVPGRFGRGVALPSARPGDSGAPILYRGASNCNMQHGTAEFWMRAPDGVDPLADDRDRYLLTILPEWDRGYGKRPGVHLVLRTHAASRSLQLAANTDHLDWYSHLNGAWIADSAKTVLHMPLQVLAGRAWHHVLCSWQLPLLGTDGEARIWLLVDGKGVTAKLAPAPEPGPQIPCYKVFLGGSYFPEVYCPSARAVLDEFRLREETVASRLAGYRAPALPGVQGDERLMMRGEDLCRYFLDLTAGLQMGGGWEGIYTWPNLMPDESPGSYAAVAEDEYTMRYVTPAFLHAYEVLGDDRYLRVAENCGQMLVKTQDERGAWCQGYIIMPDRMYPVSPGEGAIEEGTQTDPLRVLLWLWRVTGRPEYREAARKSAEFVLSGQKPDGAWPLAVNGGGYAAYSTLNDGATLWGMQAMLMGWHLTEERKYLDALLRAGDWIIRGQLPGQACGWAEQYTDDGKPAWAREFEPPATSMTAVEYAAEALFLLYDLTGDEKYLAPLRRCVQWGLNMPEQYRGYLLYVPETGEPVTSKGFKVYRFSDPGFQGASPYRTSLKYFPRLQERISSRANGPLVPSRQGPVPRTRFEQQPVTIASIAAGLPRTRAALDKPLANLAAFRRGQIPAGSMLTEWERSGRNFMPGRGAPDVQQVLAYIQCAKVLAGEVGAAAVPCYADDYLGFVDPGRDWYKTPLLQARP
jgi:hypothetical protein